MAMPPMLAYTVQSSLYSGGRPGLTGTPLDMLSPHPIGALAFDAVPVTADDVLGEPDRGFRVAMHTLNLFRPSVGACAVGICDHELQSLQRPGRHWGRLAEDDRTARAGRGKLSEALVTGARVMVEGEAELVAVERDGPVNVADRDHDDLESPIHHSVFRRTSSFS